jgi:ligand-binding sensor domain-containing protein
MEDWKKGDMNLETQMIFSNYKANGKIQWYSLKAWNDRKLRQKKINETPEAKAYFKNWYINNKNKHIEINKIAVEKRKEEFPLRLLLSSVKSGAKKRNLIIDVDNEYILNLWREQKGLCYYTNIPMKYIARNKNPFQVSIDRIDSSIGYIKGNVVLCCQAINYMKNDYSLTNFNEFFDALKLIK